MLLTCPTCQSGLQVPDGTTAHVRCPTCRTVFAPGAEPAPPPAPPPPVAAPTRPTRHPPREAAPPPRRRTRREREPEPEPDDDDRDREDDAPRRRPAPADGLTAEERRSQQAAFERAAWGCKLISLSLGLYALSMVLISFFFIRAALASDVDPALLSAAGALGLINWIVGAVGVGLCLSGQPSPGHWRFGITAAVVVVVHAIFLLAVVNRGESAAEFMRNQNTTTTTAGTLAQLPTKLDALTLYMTWGVYPGQMGAPNSVVVLSVLTGAVEMMRLAAIMLLLSCLARAAGDEDAMHKCARSAGVVCFVPGVMALGTLAVAAFIFETNAQSSSVGAILAHMLVMGVYAVLGGMILSPLTASRDTAYACEYPFEARMTSLG